MPNCNSTIAERRAVLYNLVKFCVILHNMLILYKLKYLPHRAQKSSNFALNKLLICRKHLPHILLKPPKKWLEMSSSYLSYDILSGRVRLSSSMRPPKTRYLVVKTSTFLNTYDINLKYLRLYHKPVQHLDPPIYSSPFVLHHFLSNKLGAFFSRILAN